MTTIHPTDNLVRARYDTRAASFKEDDDGVGRTMHGHFAVFNEWTEINSAWEGRFLERIAPTAFDRTIAERGDKVRVLYDHGADPSVGNKPLGVPAVLRADDTGAAYEVKLFEADYVRELVPALEAGQLGASFRFRVVKEEWNERPQRSDDNPERMPERTITDLDLFEFGPVTFPAYDQATAGVRSATDRYLERAATDPLFACRLADMFGSKIAERIVTDARSLDVLAHHLEESSDDVDDLDHTASRQTDGRPVRSISQRRALLRLAGIS
jgi:HK97 family phage prohead protease